MNRWKKDPLLAVAQAILAVAVAAIAFVAAMVLIGFGALLTVRRADVVAQLAAAGAPPSAYWGTAGILVLLLGLFLIVLRFLLELRGIVSSVDRGDPFDPRNADRLQRMGWLAVAGYALGIVIGALASWLERVAGETGNAIDISVGFDGGGILLILVLFILARVFR